MKEITITEGLAQALLDYLSRRPYNEVFQLIGAFIEESKKSQESIKE